MNKQAAEVFVRLKYYPVSSIKIRDLPREVFEKITDEYSVLELDHTLSMESFVQIVNNRIFELLVEYHIQQEFGV